MYITWILTQSSIHKNSEKNLILLNKILFKKNQNDNLFLFLIFMIFTT